MRRGLVETEFGYIHYRHTGDHHAQAIVLSHINQQSSALMIELLEKLGRTLHAVAIDYPSCGMSDHVAEQPAIHDYATVIIRVLDALKIDKASTLGEAGGAFVSADLAATYPDRVQNAILVNCPYYGNEDTKHRAHTPLKTGLRPDDASGFPMTRTLEFVLQQDPGHAPLHPTQSWMDRINVAAIEADQSQKDPLPYFADDGRTFSLRTGHANTTVLSGKFRRCGDPGRAILHDMGACRRNYRTDIEVYQ